METTDLGDRMAMTATFISVIKARRVNFILKKFLCPSVAARLYVLEY